MPLNNYFIFFFNFLCVWCSFTLSGIRWNCQFASLRKIFSERPNPSSFFFLSSWKSTKGEKSSCQKLNQATHCIKKIQCQFQKARRIGPGEVIHPIKDRCFLTRLTRSEIDSIGHMENLTTFPLLFTFCSIR